MRQNNKNQKRGLMRRQCSIDCWCRWKSKLQVWVGLGSGRCSVGARKLFCVVRASLTCQGDTFILTNRCLAAASLCARRCRCTVRVSSCSTDISTLIVIQQIQVPCRLFLPTKRDRCRLRIRRPQNRQPKSNQKFKRKNK